MTPWHMNIWKVKIWLSQEQKELLKWKSQTFYLVSQVLSFKFTKQASKIIADTTFNSDTNLRDKAKLYNGVHK